MTKCDKKVFAFSSKRLTIYNGCLNEHCLAATIASPTRSIQR